MEMTELLALKGYLYMLAVFLYKSQVAFRRLCNNTISKDFTRNVRKTVTFVISGYFMSVYVVRYYHLRGVIKTSKVDLLFLIF